MAAGDLADLTRNAVDVLPKGELERKLALGRPLRAKLGIDVTAPDVTLGHGIPLQRMAAFQRAGHIGVLIVGDYTARIGDPSGRSTTRPILSDEEIDTNAQRYWEHAATIIDPDMTEVRFNGEWLSKLDYADIIRITRGATVARLLERDDFARRFESKAPISVSELLYPLMQAYDSVAVEADIELGGTDQLYNLLMGRDLMQAYGLEPQAVMTFELLLSWDETLMSASKGNYIGLSELPEEQFRKAMRVPDNLLPQWYRLVMERPLNLNRRDPLEAKLELARFIVRRSHGEEAARRAEEHFTHVDREGRIPGDTRTAIVSEGIVHLPKVLASEFGNSTSYWRRVITQGGVRIAGSRVSVFDVPTDRLHGQILQAGKPGKEQFLRFHVGPSTARG